jgi:DNA-binding CsgD family transcriptional regulator
MTLDALAAPIDAASQRAFALRGDALDPSHDSWGSTASQAVCERTLDLLPQPVWLVQADLQLVHMNLAARAHGWGECARIVHHRLTCLGDLDARALLAAIADARRDAIAGSSQAVGLGVGGRLRRGVLRTVPVMPASRESVDPARFLMVLELPGEPADEAWLDHLCVHHRITPAERRVMSRLMRGDTPREMTDGLKVSYATVRTHLRALYAKTGCRRQAELVQLGFGG